MPWFRLDDAKAYPRAEELHRAVLWNVDKDILKSIKDPSALAIKVKVSLW